MYRNVTSKTHPASFPKEGHYSILSLQQQYVLLISNIGSALAEVCCVASTSVVEMIRFENNCLTNYRILTLPLKFEVAEQ